MRVLHLIAYDVRDPARLRRVCRYLTGFKVAGQKSVFECWVTPSELAEIRSTLEHLMEPTEDRLHIFALDPRQRVRCFGKASTFTSGFFAIT
jgi:CRISPR-associated protein Cas2